MRGDAAPGAAAPAAREEPAAGERTALKERAPVVDALAAGTLLALVRKGGIRERRAGFLVRHERFLLYPTYFHDDESELAPRLRRESAGRGGVGPSPGRVRIEHVALVERTWTVTALEPLRAIADEHALAWSAVESRFRYRGVPGVEVVAVRVARLRAAVEVPERRRYGGCVSWVELDEPVDVAGAEPVVGPEAFARRVAALAAVLDGASVGMDDGAARPDVAG